MLPQMTPKERILGAIDHKDIDKIPTDYWATFEAHTKLKKALGIKNDMELWRRLEIDKILNIRPKYIGPDFGPNKDYWQVESKTIRYANDEASYEEMSTHPLSKFETIKEIEENYTWPKADWFDFSDIEKACKKNENYAVEAGYVAPFFFFNNLRGLEQSLMDLILEEELSEYIISKICEFFYDYHKRLFEAANGRIDITQVTDDYGSQNSLLISIDTFKKYFKPYYIKFIELAKSYQIRIFHHDDGSIMPIIPEMVELGIDVLNPIQWHLPNMDLNELKSKFGKDICFHGAIDNQDVLPFGSVDDVKKEVRTCLDILGSDHTGFILAPCHNIQVISPVKNIITMYEEANRLR